jgi:hypothetical protein
MDFKRRATARTHYSLFVISGDDLVVEQVAEFLALRRAMRLRHRRDWTRRARRAELFAK